MNANVLMTEIMSLPVEQRTKFVETLLQSLNQPEPSIDTEWAELAQARLKELKSEKIEAIDGNQVFKKIQNRWVK